MLFEGFDWKGLKHNSVIVDVGGGLGSQSMTLAQTFPHLRFIIQDREPVLKDTAVVRIAMLYYHVAPHLITCASSGTDTFLTLARPGRSLSKVCSLCLS